MTRPIECAVCTALLLAVAVPSRAAAESANHDPASSWNHDPASSIGPSFWGTLSFPFGTCGSRFPSPDGPFTEVGARQSPIDIAAPRTADVPEPQFHYRETPFEIENTGHVIEVPCAPGSTLVLGDDTYDLVQFHFHVPSEHAMAGRRSSMELHLVHQNLLGDVAVVGVLVEVGPNPNPLLEEILAQAPLLPGTVALEGETLDPRDLLPKDLSPFFAYTGSLTTPPCSEGVRWNVLANPVSVSQAALERFRRIVAKFPGYDGFEANSRPLAPLNGRVILTR